MDNNLPRKRPREEDEGDHSSHSWSVMTIGGDARVHNGHVYNNAGPSQKDQLMASLHSPWLDERRTRVKEPAPSTYEWIFRDELVYRLTSTRWTVFPSFTDWLASDSSSTYWISGKAGSGKSTLMGHIVDDSRTGECLSKWSKHKSVHILTFFFWKAGHEIQRSASGLLRAILYQLIGLLTSSSIRKLLDDSDLHEPSRITWTEKRLKAAIKTAILISKDKCFAIFIDGLDEFAGHYDDLMDLIDELHAPQNIKCCVSSRPEATLEHRLQQYDHLRMQDLTFADIEKVVNMKLQRAQVGFGFSSKVTLKADGVFLWAILVANDLALGAASGDTAAILEQRLRRLPREMNDLYRRMLDAIDLLHRPTFVFYLQCLAKRLGTPSIVEITLARLNGVVNSWTELIAACEQTKTQISAQSAGLLEIWCQRIGIDWENLHGVQEFPTSARPWLSSPVEVLKRQKLTKKRQWLTIRRYENVFPTWIHRSAYDFLFEQSEAQHDSLDLHNGMDETIKALLHGKLWMLFYGPANQRGSGERLAELLETIGCLQRSAPGAYSQFLDTIRVHLNCFHAGEVFSQTPRMVDESWFDVDTVYKIWDISGAPLYFWVDCYHRKQWDYILANIDSLLMPDSKTNCIIIATVGRGLVPGEEVNQVFASVVCTLLEGEIQKALCASSRRKASELRLLIGHDNISRWSAIPHATTYRLPICHWSPRSKFLEWQHILLLQMFTAVQTWNVNTVAEPIQESVDKIHESFANLFELASLCNELCLRSTLEPTCRSRRLSVQVPPLFTRANVALNLLERAGTLRFVFLLTDRAILCTRDCKCRKIGWRETVDHFLVEGSVSTMQFMLEHRMVLPYIVSLSVIGGSLADFEAWQALLVADVQKNGNDLNSEQIQYALTCIEEDTHTWWELTDGKWEDYKGHRGLSGPS